MVSSLFKIKKTRTRLRGTEMAEKIIGILGGMGPEATIDFFTKIVKGTKVRKDQDHLRILIDNNPKIPNRTLAIQGKGPSPLPQLVQSARVLERAGAQFIVIPCVTAHHFYDSLQKKVRIPMVHIVWETRRYLQNHFKKIDKIGLLATTGTLQSGLFQNAFAHTKIELIVPPPDAQKNQVMEAIFGKEGIKAFGPSVKSKRLIREVSRKLIRQGAQVIIAGCTEVPLVLKEGDLPVPVIDPVAVLAKVAIEKAQAKSK
jgi:aspartate racemase